MIQYLTGHYCRYESNLLRTGVEKILDVIGTKTITRF